MPSSSHFILLTPRSSLLLTFFSYTGRYMKKTSIRLYWKKIALITSSLTLYVVSEIRNIEFMISLYARCCFWLWNTVIWFPIWYWFEYAITIWLRNRRRNFAMMMETRDNLVFFFLFVHFLFSYIRKKIIENLLRFYWKILLEYLFQFIINICTKELGFVKKRHITLYLCLRQNLKTITKSFC